MNLPVLPPLALLAPVVLGIYALAFVAGGLYLLEQRVARIRDQFPRRAWIARLTGLAALGIGLLAAAAAGGHFAWGAAQYRLAAIVSTGAGTVFWIHRFGIDWTPISRGRDGAMAFVCAALTLLTSWWALQL